MKLAQIVEELNKEPLTHLMLGNRELFHSNIIAWFFEFLPDFSDAVFKPLSYEVSSGQQRSVLREHRNFDFVLNWPTHSSIIIENKVFSLPNEKQLFGYSEVADAGYSLWLLSLVDPGWSYNKKVLNGREWRWIGFKRLALAIRASISSAEPSYEVETMRHYCRVVELLDDLVSEVAARDGGETVSHPAVARLSLAGERLGGTLAKFRAHSVAVRVGKAISEKGFDGERTYSTVAHALPLIEWFTPVKLAPAAQFGWQLQGDEFRLALKLPHLAGRSDRERETRAAFAREHSALFDFSTLDEPLRTKEIPERPPIPASGELTFKRFDPDFVYRSKVARNITVSMLEEVAVRVGELAKGCML